MGDMGIMTVSCAWRGDQEQCRAGAGWGARPETQQVFHEQHEIYNKEGTEVNSFWCVSWRLP